MMSATSLVHVRTRTAAQEYGMCVCMYICTLTKDYIEKIDFQELFIAVVNWPNSELDGAFVCIMHYLDQSATS